jgi:hypothetical protein
MVNIWKTRRGAERRHWPLKIGIAGLGGNAATLLSFEEQQYEKSCKDRK